MKNVVLLDGDIALWRAVLAGGSTVDWGGGDIVQSVNIPTAIAQFRKTLESLRERFKTRDVRVAFGDRSANWRKELEPTYKANRRAVPKPLGFTELEAEIAAKCKVFREPKLEGDDVLGLLATHAPEGERRIICSIDKDMLTVPGSHYNFDTGVEREVSEEDAHRAHLRLTLTGDRTDNFPGCPGFGPKRSDRWLLENGATWASIIEAFCSAGKSPADALHQARLAFVLRRGWYDRTTKTIRLWTGELAAEAA